MPLREEAVAYLKSLREQIIAGFTALETSSGPKGTFQRKLWNYSNGTGGGEMSVLRGNVFEKAAVNFSAVSGNSFPMADGMGPFFATGISLITHMSNPYAPTVHMNLRYISTEKKQWIGGGYDLTPMGFPIAEDTAHFHQVAKETLDPFGEDLYARFSQQARDYFFIPHWGGERGVGGIFFDHYDSKQMAMWRALGNRFLEAIIPIYQRRVGMPFTDQEREKQLQMRGRYVEFNLLYDRGTKFGFQSGGNPEAILCSMPPLVKW
jgi:coproporphyrinogen III oxidase